MSRPNDGQPQNNNWVDRWNGSGMERWVKRTEDGQWYPSSTMSYYESSIAVQPWAQTDADFGAVAEGSARGHVSRTNSYWGDATITFHFAVDVVTPGTGEPRFYIREMIRSLHADFSGWYWGWGNPSSLRCPVHGQIAGLPFTGFVNRSGYILDANGDSLSRVLVTGDYLIGTVIGVFQND